MKGLSPEQKRDLIMSVGTHKSRRRLQPVEVAELVQKALDAGNSPEEVASGISLSTRVLKKFTSLLSLPSGVRAMIGWRVDASTISFTAGAEIARLEAIREQHFLAGAVLEHQLRVPEVKQVIQIRQRSSKSIEDSVKAVLEQRPVVERRQLFIGKLLSKELEQRLKEMTQQERTELLRRALNRYGPGTPSLGVRLGTQYFVIVCDDDYFGRLTSLSDDLESFVTQHLTLEAASER